MNDLRRTARLAGALWLIVIVAGVISSGAAADSLGQSNSPAQGFFIAMVFFGAQIISIGYLITRSTLIPRLWVCC